MMNEKEKFMKMVESVTGLSAEQICDISLDEQRELIEKKKGHGLRFRSYFPFIGRGMVLHDRLVSREKADEALEEALR